MLNAGSAADQQTLAQLPGFVPAEDAVTEKSDKRDVLDRMEKSGILSYVLYPLGVLIGILGQVAGVKAGGSE